MCGVDFRMSQSLHTHKLGNIERVGHQNEVIILILSLKVGENLSSSKKNGRPD